MYGQCLCLPGIARPHCRRHAARRLGLGSRPCPALSATSTSSAGERAAAVAASTALAVCLAALPVGASEAGAGPGSAAGVEAVPQHLQHAESAHRTTLWGAYSTALRAHPLAAKVATAAACSLVSDAVAQAATTARPPAGAPSTGDAPSTSGRDDGPATASGAWRYDWQRGMRLVMFGAVVGTPLAHYWFAYLDHAVFPASPSSPAAVAAKVGRPSARAGRTAAGWQATHVAAGAPPAAGAG